MLQYSAKAEYWSFIVIVLIEVKKN